MRRQPARRRLAGAALLLVAGLVAGCTDYDPRDYDGDPPGASSQKLGPGSGSAPAERRRRPA